MQVKQLIEKAVGQGWRWEHYPHGQGLEFEIISSMKDVNEGVLAQWKHNDSSFQIEIKEAVLDPDFWKALGKALGWSTLGTSDIPQSHKPEWREKQLDLITHLQDGGTIESFANTIND